MKKLLTIALFFLCLGCAKQEADVLQTGRKKLCFTVSSETKSVYSDGSEAIEWTRGDRMSVFDGTANNKFSTQENGPSASFSGEVSAAASGITVLYPYRENASLNGGSVETEILSTQWAVANSFSDGANIAIGSAGAASSKFSLKNVGGYVSITLPSGLAGITGIDFSANGGETLSGTVSISLGQDGIPVTSSASGSSKVSLLAPHDTIPSGCRYYFVANPVTLASGFTVTLHRIDAKQAVFSSQMLNTVRRNKVLNLGTVNVSALEWTDEPAAATRTVEYDFSDGAWPFDEAPGNVSWPETDKTYVGLEGGYMLRVKGRSSFDGEFTVSTDSETCPSIELPGLPGHRLSSVRVVPAAGEQSVFFSDLADNTDYSVKELRGSDALQYRIQGAAEGEPVLMRSFSSISFSKLVLEYNCRVDSPCCVESVGTVSDSGEASFSFNGGTSSDYEFGVEYLPLGTKLWSGASILAGEKISESGGTLSFKVTLPSGDCMARAFARPRDTSCSKMYGPLWYPLTCRLDLVLDFTTTNPFTASGSVQSGSGTFEDPRKGIGFPTATQQVTSQTTGATSNFGAGYWTGTKYIAYFPYTEYVVNQGGREYAFKIGVPHGTSDRYIYWSTKYRVRTAYFVITYPVIEGFRLSKIGYYQSTRSSAPAVFVGIGEDPDCLGETNVGGQPAYQYYFTPSALGSGTVFSSTCRHIFHIDRIDLHYVKCNE